MALGSSGRLDVVLVSLWCNKVGVLQCVCSETWWGRRGGGGTVNSRGGGGVTVSSKADGREQVVVLSCGCFCSTMSPEQLPFAVLGPLLAQPWQLLRD